MTTTRAKKVQESLQVVTTIFEVVKIY